MRTTAFGFLLILLCCPVPAQAVVYNVNRSFPHVTLTGTVTCPIGNFVIEQQSPSPITDVNLVMTMDGYTPYNLDSVTTQGINNTAKFFIDATATTLTFSTSHTNNVTFSDILSFSISGNGGVYYVRWAWRSGL